MSEGISQKESTSTVLSLGRVKRKARTREMRMEW
jgi:hypothetical protein